MPSVFEEEWGEWNGVSGVLVGRQREWGGCRVTTQDPWGV